MEPKQEPPVQIKQLESASSRQIANLVDNQTHLQQLYEQRIQVLQHKFDQVSHEKEKMAVEIINIRKSLNACESEKSTQSHQLESAKSQIDLLKAQHQQVQQINDQKQVLLVQAQDEREQLRIQLQQTIDQLRQENSDVRQQLAKLIHDEGALQNEKTAMTIKIQGLEHQFQQVNKEKESLDQKLFEMQSKLSDSMSQLSEKDFEVSNLTRKLESFNKNFLSERQNYEAQIQSKNQMIIESQNQLNTLKLQLNQEQSKIENFSKEQFKLQDKIRVLETQKSQLTSELTYAQSEKSRLMRDYEQCQKYRERLEVDNQKYIKEIGDFSKREKALQSALRGDESMTDIEAIIKHQTGLESIISQTVEDFPLTLKKAQENQTKLVQQIGQCRKMLEQCKDTNYRLMTELQNTKDKLKHSESKFIHMQRNYVSMNDLLQKRNLNFSLVKTQFDCLWRAVKETNIDSVGIIDSKFRSILLIEEEKNQFEFADKLENEDQIYQNYQFEKGLKEDLEKEVSNLKRKLALREDEDKQKERHILQLNAKLKEGNQVSFESSQQIQSDSHTQCRASMEQIHNQYMTQLEEKLTQIANLRTHLTQTQDELQKLKIQVQNQPHSQSLANGLNVSRQEYEKVQGQYVEKLSECNQLKIEITKLEEEARRANQKAEFEAQNRSHYERRSIDLQMMLEDERNQVQSMKRLTLEQGNQDAVNQQSEFRALSQTITQMQQDKAKLSSELNSKQVELVQAQVELHNVKLISEGLKAQLTKEQELRKELQAMIEQMSQSQQLKQRADPNAELSAEAQTLEKINQDLKALLFTQKEETEKELLARDQLIEQLQQMLCDVNERLSQQQVKYDTGMQEITKGHQEEISKGKDLLQESERERAKLEIEKRELEEKCSGYQQEREKYQITTEMQAQELQRLITQLESQDPATLQKSQSVQLSAMKFRETSDRLDQIELKNQELQSAYNLLKAQYDQQQENHQKETQVLQEEADELRERESVLKRELEVLQRHLDQIGKKAQMAGNESQINVDTQMVEKERVAKTEQELERIRSNYHEQLKQNQDLINEKLSIQFQLAQAQDELQRVKQQQVHKDVQLRLLEEVNEANNMLREERMKLIESNDALRKELMDVRGKYDNASPVLRAKCEDLIKQVVTLNEELNQAEDIKDNLSKEIDKLQSGSSTTGTSLATPTEQFKGLYRSLQKAKHIVNAAVDLVILQDEMMTAQDDELVQGQMLGKRQRKEQHKE